MSNAWIPGRGIVNTLPSWEQQGRNAKAQLGIFEEPQVDANDLMIKNEQLQSQLDAALAFNNNENLVRQYEEQYRQPVAEQQKYQAPAQTNDQESNDFLDTLLGDTLGTNSQPNQQSNQEQRVQPRQEQQQLDPQAVNALRELSVEASRYGLKAEDVIGILNKTSIKEQVAFAANKLNGSQPPVSVAQNTSRYDDFIKAEKRVNLGSLL